MRARIAFARALLALLRLGVGVVPLVVLLFWAELYLWRCTQALCAPGVPVVVEYAGANGPVKASVGSYFVDLASLTAQVHQVSVLSSEGARAEAASATVHLVNGVTDVHVSKLRANLTRRPDGTIDLSSLGLKPTGAPDTGRTVIHIDQADIQYIESGHAAIPVRLTATVGDGAMGNWAIATKVTAAGLSALPLVVDISSDQRIRVEGKFANQDLMSLVPYLDQRSLLPKEAKPWTVGSAIANGTFAASIKGKTITALGSLSLAITHIHHPEWVKDGLANIQLDGTGDSVGVRATAIDGGAKLRFDGTVALSPALDANGSFESTIRSYDDIPSGARKAFSYKLKTSNMHAVGRVRYLKSQIQGSALVSLEKGEGLGHSVHDVQMKAVSDGRIWGVQLVKGVVDKTPLTGSVTGRISDGTLAGWVEPKGDLGSLVAPYLPKEASINGHASVAIGGTLRNPLVHIVGNGSGHYLLPNGQTLLVNSFAADGSLNGDHVLVRSQLATANGKATLSGTVPIDSSKPLALDLGWSGIDFAAVDKDTRGISEGSGKVTGTLQKPEFIGSMTAVNGGYLDQAVPFAQSSLKYKDSLLNLTQVEASFGGGLVRGWAAWNPITDALSGTLNGNGISLARLGVQDALARGEVLATLGGTARDPHVQADGRIGAGYVAGYSIDSAFAHAAYADNKIDLSKIAVVAGTGTVTGSAHATRDTQDWIAHLAIKDIHAERLRDYALDSHPSGSVTADAELQGRGTQILSGSVKGKLDNLAAYAHQIGSGPFDVRFKDNVATFTGTVGDDNRYAQFDPSTVDLKTGKARVDATVTNVPIAEMVSAILPRMSAVDPKLQESLSKIDGKLAAHVLGDWDGVTLGLDSPNITIDGITFENHPAGTLTTRLTKKGNVIDIPTLDWKYQDNLIHGSVSWDTKGPVSGGLHISNLDSSLVSSLFPAVPIAGGSLNDATLQLDGTADNPHVLGSLGVNKLLLRDSSGRPVKTPLDISLYQIEYKDRAITANGDFSVQALSAEKDGSSFESLVRGLTGTIEASVPLDSLGATPTKKFEAKIALGSARPLSSLAAYLPEIDEKQTKGQVTGDVRVYGDIKATHISGSANLSGDKGVGGANLGLKNSKFSFQNLLASVNATESGIDAAASFNSSEGGNAAMKLHGTWDDVFAGGFSFDSLRDKSALTGELNLKNLVVKSTLPKATAPSTATVSASLSLGGSVGAPSIGGVVDISGVTAVLPLIFDAPTGSGTPSVDPVFKGISVSVAKGSVVDTAGGRFVMGGQGEIRGRLSDPNVRFGFDIDRGTLKLLTNRVTIDEGSTLDLVMAGQGTDPRLDLNLRGRTNVTERTSGDQYQTYALNLNITGNLMETTPLHITGSSDPPGLSDTRIAEIVGERSFLESIANSATGQTGSDSLRSSLYSVAIPSLTDFLTGPLAEGLGLDYLTLDYNPFDQTILNLGKKLGTGLQLQYTRQLIDPIIGIRREELSLSYQLPSKNRILSQTRISLTKTQTVPLRFGISFAQRF